LPDLEKFPGLRRLAGSFVARYLIQIKSVSATNELWRLNYMSMTDPIADMLTRIRNASTARHDEVDVPASNVKKSIAQILMDEGYIKSYKLLEDNKQGVIRMQLKYAPDKKGVISGIRRVSKPGCKIYVTKDKLPQVRGGYGSAIISTSKGIMTSSQCKKEHVGGEVLCYIW